MGTTAFAVSKGMSERCVFRVVMDGRLNHYLVDTDGQAQKRFEWLVEQLKQAQGITE